MSGSEPLENLAHERYAKAMAAGEPSMDAYLAAFPTRATETDRNRQGIWQDAWRLRQRPLVRERIAYLRRMIDEAEEADMMQDVRVNRAILNLDVRQALDDTGMLLPVHALPENVAVAVKAVEVDEYGKVKLTFLDKHPAIEREYRRRGRYEKDNRQSVDAALEGVRALFAAAGGAIVKARPEAATYSSDDDGDDD